MTEQHQLVDFKRKALTAFSVFTQSQTILGLPSKVFFLGAFITCVVLFFLYWLAGFAFGIAYFYAMYHIHEKDPKAFDIWLKAMRRFMVFKTDRWRAANTKSTRLIVIQ